MKDLDDIKNKLPRNANIDELKYEGSDIAIYTNSKKFFLDNEDVIKEIVQNIKKRVEVRPSSKLFKKPEKAKKILENEIIKDEAGLEELIFQPSFGKVIIRAEKPGKVIGHNGKGLEKIKKETLWKPEVERVPAIQSDVVDKARELTVEDPEFRKEFLHDVGKKIRLEKSAGDEWIRISSLGGFRQVGRSCVLIQTEESNVLMDAGINPAAEPGTTENYPYLNAPELNLQDLDAVVLTHAHMDHCLTPETPVTMSDGSRKPIAQVKEGDELKTYNWQERKVEEGKCLKKKEVKDEEYYKIQTNYNNIKASGDHKFFIFKDLGVEEVEAEQLQEGDFIPRKQVERNQETIKTQEPNYQERVEITSQAQQELRTKRKEKGLTCKEASKKIDQGVNYIQQLETKYENVNINTLKKYNEILNNDFAKFKERHGIKHTRYPDLDREVAQILGYFYGDGHRDGNRLRLTDKNKECLENYAEAIEQKFNYQPNLRDHCDRSKNAYQLEINNKGIVKFFDQNFEGLYRNTTESTIPDKILYGPKQVVEGFLKGLFDAEGSVTSNVTIAQTGKQTRENIQDLLSTVGIKATSDKTKKVSITGKSQITKFATQIGSSHPKKTERLQKLKDLDAVKKEKQPLIQKNLKRILDDAGILGKVAGSPDYKELPTPIVDWYRRSEESAATTETVQKLVKVLKGRVNELKNIENCDIKKIRKNISLTRKEVAVQTQNAEQHHLQVIEDQKYNSEYRKEIEKTIQQAKEEKIQKTQQNIEKLEKLISTDVEWHRIKSKKKQENEYGYLVDLKVSPNENFIANDQIVHNCGMVPYLYKMGYDGPLYCTEPTRDLMIMLTLDYIGLAHSENNKAPYDSSDIKKAVKRTITPDYGDVTDIAPDMRLTLKNSGHIIGSALTHIHVGEGLHNILYTGDYNYDHTEMLQPANTNFRRVETMITEATYGGRNDKQTKREESDKKFVSKMKETLDRGGKVIVPAFAVGRSQEILGLLADEMDKDYFDYPVYIDGMINSANALHTAYPEFLSEKVQKKVFKEEDSPFLKDNIDVVGSYHERQEVHEDDACVILTTSGMLTGGPVLSYLKESADNPDNTLIFVGYQADGTLGDQIQSGNDTVEIDGEEVEINLETETVSGFSAHSDRQQIINFCKNLRSSPNRVFTNHGEKSKCFSLASTLHKILNIDTSAPQNLEVNRLN